MLNSKHNSVVSFKIIRKQSIIIDYSPHASSILIGNILRFKSLLHLLCFGTSEHNDTKRMYISLLIKKLYESKRKKKNWTNVGYAIPKRHLRVKGTAKYFYLIQK